MKYLPVLLMSLALIACSSNDAVPTEPTPTEIIEQTFDPDSPEAVVEAYTTACITGDGATALSLTIPEIRALLAGSTPCDIVDQDVINDAYIGTEVVGETTYVTWELEWPERTIHYKFALADVADEGSRIFEGSTVYVRSISVQTEPIEPENVIQEDPNLPSEMSYVLNAGVAGEKEVTTEMISTEEDTETTVIDEQVITPAQSGITVVGTATTIEAMAQAKAIATDYFMAYEANDWNTVIAMAYEDDIDNYDIATANGIAQTRILDIDIDDVAEMAYFPLENIATTSIFSLSTQQTHNVPVAVRYEMPAFVRYEVFGQVATWEGTAIVWYTPDGWVVRYWGVRQAGEAQTMTRDEYEFTVNGVAVLPDRVTAVFTPIRPLDFDEYSILFGDDVRTSQSRYNNVVFGEDMVGVVTIQTELHSNASTVSIGYRVYDLGTYTYEGEAVLPLR